MSDPTDLENSPAMRRATLIAGAIGAHGVIAIVLFVLLLAATLFYGPAWVALNTRHSPFVSAIICAAVPAGAWWVVFAASMIVKGWNRPPAAS